MKSLTMGLTLFCIVSLYPAQSKANDNVLVWNVVPGNDFFIHGGTSYRLFNTYNRSYLDYFSRDRGINLAFNVHLSSPNITIINQRSTIDPIHYGDRIAIKIDRGGYLIYSERTYGINLDYSSTPKFEWEIRDISYLNSNSDNHSNVEANATFALINTSIHAYVIYGERTWGPNLTWATTAPQPIPTEAVVNLSLRTGPHNMHSPTTRCTGRVVWTFTPLILDESPGRSTSLVIDRSYNVTETTVSPTEIWCIFNDFVSGLKNGTWRIRAQTSEWSGECEVVLGGGTNRVNFTQHKVGCGIGGQYP